MNEKIIIIDCQLLQTNALHRGMGKYLLQLIKGIGQVNSGEYELIALFNDNLPIDYKCLNQMKEKSKTVKQIIVKLPIARDNQLAQTYKRTLNEVLRKVVNKQNYTYIIPSLFSFDFYVEFPDAYQKIIIIYDLIPLLYWKELGKYFPPYLYMARFNTIYEADLILAISETTKKSIINIFGFEPSKIVNINGGFTKLADANIKPKSFKVPETYLLFPTGDLPHKNNELVVRGVKGYNQTYSQDIPLLITSDFSTSSILRLTDIYDNIIFTGNVKDEELSWLFDHAKAIIFGSKYEGLGMPILDAVSMHKPIITSKIDVFLEMSSEAFYYFSPNIKDQLIKEINDAILGIGFDKKKAEYEKILAKYKWTNTANSALSALKTLEDTPRDISNKNMVRHKTRLAIICLHPGLKNQIGRLAEPLYSRLYKVYKIDYFFDPQGKVTEEMQRPTYLDQLKGCRVLDIGQFNSRTYKHYSLLLFILDDSSFPSRVAQRACIFSGNVIDATTNKDLKASKHLKALALENQKKSLKIIKNKYSIQDICDFIQTASKGIDYNNMKSQYKQKRSMILPFKKLKHD